MVKINYELNNEGVYNLLEAFLIQCRKDYLSGNENLKYNSPKIIEQSITDLFGPQKGDVMVLELRRQKKSINRKQKGIYNLIVVKDKAGK